MTLDTIDFFVDSKPLTEKEKSEISEVIAYYKLTGQKKKMASHTKDLISKKNASVREKL